MAKAKKNSTEEAKAKASSAKPSKEAKSSVNAKKVSGEKPAPSKPLKPAGKKAEKTSAGSAKVGESTPRKAAGKKTAQEEPKKPARSAPRKSEPAAKKAVSKAKPKSTSKSSPKASAKARETDGRKEAAQVPVSDESTTRRNGQRPKREEPVTPQEYLKLEAHEKELPLEYGDTKVVLLVRDPEWVFAYWEISQEARRRHGLAKGSHKKPLALRVYEYNGNGKSEPYDVAVNDYTSSWYIRVPSQSSKLRVELGIFNEKGKFVALAGSNEVRLPHMGISEEVDLEFAEINDEIYGQILHLSGGAYVSEHLGSEQFLQSLQQKIIESLLGGPFSSAGLQSSGQLSSWSPSSGLFSGQFSSGALSSSSFPALNLPMAGAEDSVQRVRAQQDDFWLEVGVDVIVYGATEPNAKVKFMGQDIELNPDGTFRFRMVFPDATIDFPIEATSADGKHRRSVKPVVSRRTEGDPRKPS